MEIKENIKIGLLAIIAFVLIVNTFFNEKTPVRYAEPENIVKSNIAAKPLNTFSNISNPNQVLPSQQIKQNPPTQLSQSRSKTAVNFPEMNYNFGKIKQDTKNTKIFKFTNVGSEPLIIENAVGSCGCTVPTWPKKPIAPGETGEIEVTYSPGKQQGVQNKTVTITANTNPITTVLNITANVEVTP